MNTSLVAVFISLLVGTMAGYLIGAGTHQEPSAPQIENGSISMEDAMSSMNAGLYGKQGAAFDQAFLSEMIVHHEGAVQMAELALQNAQHDEIKAMATAIINAQKAEIEQMQVWQADWYGLEPSRSMDSHATGSNLHSSH